MSDKEPLFDNTWQPPDRSFVPLAYMYKKPTVEIGTEYIVISKEGERKQISAPTALTAMQETGITDPARIIKIGTAKYNLFHAHGLAEQAGDAPADNPDATSTLAEPVESVPEDAPESEAAPEGEPTNDGDPEPEASSE